MDVKNNLSDMLGFKSKGQKSMLNNSLGQGGVCVCVCLSVCECVYKTFVGVHSLEPRTKPGTWNTHAKHPLSE